MKFDLLFSLIKDEKIINIITKDFDNFFNSKSQNFKVLSYFKINNSGTAENLAEIGELKEFQISTILKRLNDSFEIEAIDKEGKFKVYKITEKGLMKLNRSYNSFLNNNYDYKEYISETRKAKVNNTKEKEHHKLIHNCLINSNLRPNERDMIIVNMKELAEFDFEATEFIYSNFKESVEIILNYFKDDIEHISEDNIKFINIQETELKPIHHFDREDIGLIFTKGLVSSKKEAIISKATQFKFNCENPSCEFAEKPLLIDKDIRKKGIAVCFKCKSQLTLIEENRINQLESKITDVESSISFPIYIQGKKTRDFSYVGLGDEIEVIGHLEDKVIENINGVCEITKVLIVNNFFNTDYVKELTREEKREVEETLNTIKKPIDYLLKPFVNYIESDWVKEMFIIQQLTRLDLEQRETPIHIAMMGEPGVGKNELIKIAEKYFPTCDSIVGADITDAGFKGTVNRDTGIKEIGLAKKCQGGTLFFNEFDKFVKSNPNGKKGASQLLNASITEQEIRLNKAGIRIRMQNLNLRHNIVFNPLDDKVAEKQKTPYDLMGQILDKSLLSRMLPIYIGKDKKRTTKVFDIQLGDVEFKKLPEPKIYKLVIRHLRSIDIEFTPKAKELLKQIWGTILENDKYDAISTERISLMFVQLCKGVCRLNNKIKCDKHTVEKVQKLYWKCLNSVGISLENIDQLFLDKNPEEISEMVELKHLILRDITLKGKFNIEDLKDMKNKEIISDVIFELKRDENLFEPRKNELRRIN